ncbi:hypothetical protein H7097_03780 [Aeromicrobium sp.]|nr:hypothetical protein [Candidatus Saccharibacteria bacterium]
MIDPNNYTRMPADQAAQILGIRSGEHLAVNQSHDQPQTVAEQPRRQRHVVLAAGVAVAASLLLIGRTVDHAQPASGSSAPEEAATSVALAIVKPTTEAAVVPLPTAVQQIVPVDPKTFTASPVGCVPTSSVTIAAEAPVSWYSSLQASERMFATQRGDYHTTMTGSAAVYGCLNDMRAVTYNQALSEQSGITTFSVDASDADLNVDTSSAKTAIAVYDESIVYKSLQKGFKDEAKPIDAVRLLRLISNNSGSIDELNRYYLESKLTVPNRLGVLSAQAISGIIATLQTQAQSQGINNEAIQFAATGSITRKELPFMNKIKPPAITDDYKYFEEAANFNLTITPVGGTS